MPERFEEDESSNLARNRSLFASSESSPNREKRKMLQRIDIAAASSFQCVLKMKTQILFRNLEGQKAERFFFNRNRAVDFNAFASHQIRHALMGIDRDVHRLIGEVDGCPD